MSDDLVASGYDAVYGGLPSSPTFERIWDQHARGIEYPPSSSDKRRPQSLT